MNVEGEKERERRRVKEGQLNERRMSLVNERASEEDTGAILYEYVPSRWWINFCTSVDVCVYINWWTCARIAVAPGGTCLSQLAN